VSVEKSFPVITALPILLSADAKPCHGPMATSGSFLLLASQSSHSLPARKLFTHFTGVREDSEGVHLDLSVQVLCLAISGLMGCHDSRMLLWEQACCKSKNKQTKNKVAFIVFTLGPPNVKENRILLPPSPAQNLAHGNER